MLPSTHVRVHVYNDDRVHRYTGTMILAFLNQKGGVGKSTLSTNAADYMHRQGAKTLLIDADPQGTTNDWAARRDAMTFPRDGARSGQHGAGNPGPCRQL